jgi:hypothetical protein
MKTTIDLPDDLLMEAKKAAVDRRTTLKGLMERALRRELAAKPGRPKKNKKIRWVIVKGGVAPGVNIRSRVEMLDWVMDDRPRH